jgi:hypothetical protein
MNNHCQLCHADKNLIKDRDIGTVCKDCNDTVVKVAQNVLFQNDLRFMRLGELSDRRKLFGEAEDGSWAENS